MQEDHLQRTTRLQRHCKRIAVPLTFCAAMLITREAALAQQAEETHWVGTWAASPMAPSASDEHSFCDVTIREIVHVSVGGGRIRVRFTNEFGSNPLAIGAARIALSADKSSIQAETDRSLNFSGENSAQIPAGSILLSDPVELNVPPLSDVAVSLYLPCQHLEHSTFHDEALQVNYLGAGNQTSAQTVHNSTELDSWYFLDGVDVEESGGSPGTVVALGDSLTEGAYSGVSKNHRWTDFLAKRLQENKITAQLGVLNEGIGGNRLLHDGYGPSALARFNRDVLAQSDLRFLIVLEGTNDIGHLVKPPVAKVTAHELETALAQIATRAHAAGIKVYGATMLPYFGASYYSEDGEKIREEVNAWIREGSAFDAVIDFDKAIRDPQDVKRILPGYDHDDHLHLNEQGYKAMADAIDLHLFK